MDKLFSKINQIDMEHREIKQESKITQSLSDLETLEKLNRVKFDEYSIHAFRVPFRVLCSRIAAHVKWSAPPGYDYVKQ